MINLRGFFFAASWRTHGTYATVAAEMKVLAHRLKALGHRGRQLKTCKVLLLARRWADALSLGVARLCKLTRRL